MSDSRTVLITGARGNLGRKLRVHWQERYDLRLLDIDPKGDQAISQADLSVWDQTWASLFEGVDTVVHLAADPGASQPWDLLVGPNIDGLINVFTVSARAGVKRVVYASSNHVMGGYIDIDPPHELTTEIPVRPGAHYHRNGQPLNSVAYGGAKLVGERLGKTFADIYGLSTIAVRIGWVRPGENRATDIPPEIEEWFRLMWLSNRDFCQLMTGCVEANPSTRFAIVNGMSNNTGMRWDIEHTRNVTGYQPLDDVKNPE